MASEPWVKITSPDLPGWELDLTNNQIVVPTDSGKRVRLPYNAAAAEISAAQRDG